MASGPATWSCVWLPWAQCCWLWRCSCADGIRNSAPRRHPGPGRGRNSGSAGLRCPAEFAAVFVLAKLSERSDPEQPVCRNTHYSDCKAGAAAAAGNTLFPLQDRVGPAPFGRAFAAQHRLEAGVLRHLVGTVATALTAVLDQPRRLRATDGPFASSTSTPFRAGSDGRPPVGHNLLDPVLGLF